MVSESPGHETTLTGRASGQAHTSELNLDVSDENKDAIIPLLGTFLSHSLLALTGLRMISETPCTFQLEEGLV